MQPDRVSIRSRPEGRERVTGNPTTTVTAVFQSAPDPKAGREDVVAQTSRDLAVSIRSRPEGRERAPLRNVTMARARGFNPLPTRRPGERM